MAVTFKEQVEAQSGGAIKVQIFPEGQLGADAQAVALVKKGVIQMAISSVGGMAKLYPLITAMDFPFAYNQVSEAYAVLDGPFGQFVRDDMEAKTGLAVLGFGDTGGLFVLTNSKHAIHRPSDMAGLRIRTMAFPPHKVVVSSLGAEAVTIPWNYVLDALMTGLADGQINPISTTRYGRLHTVQKYMTLTNHAYVPFLWTANRAFLTGLSDEERQIIAEAVTSGVRASRSLAISVTGDRLAALLPSVQIHSPTETELTAFRRVTQPAARAFVAETLGDEGTRFLDSFLTAVDKARRDKSGGGARW
jgi:tripartite ATP-independent transporter DctP family solute receptor